MARFQARLAVAPLITLLVAVALTGAGLYHGARSQSARPNGQAIVPQTSLYTGPDASAVATANVAVTVFLANTVRGGCDILNTNATTVLYVDFTTTAVVGSATAFPLQPGQSYHCPFPPSGPVSAVAAAAMPYIAIRY